MVATDKKFEMTIDPSIFEYLGSTSTTISLPRWCCKKKSVMRVIVF